MSKTAEQAASLGASASRPEATTRSRFHAVAMLATPVLTLIVLGVLLEIGVRLVVDDGMNLDLEMWKYAHRIKQRSANPLIGHEHRPFARAHLMGVDVATNSLGHRDREYPIARQPGIPRVIMLGDSLTEGWGVRFEETASKRLEALFARSGRQVEVINTGVGNYGSVQEVEAFMTRDAPFRPDLIVLNFDFRSAIPIPRYGYDGWIVRHSEALAFLVSGTDAVQRLLGAKKHWDEDYLALFDQPGWQAAKAAIHRLADYCRRNQIKLLIACWPEFHDVQHYRLERITQLAHEIADEERVPFVDLLEAVKDQDSSKLWVTPPDPHPNGYANGLCAEYLFPILQKMLAQ